MPTINTKDLPEFETVRLIDLTEDSINHIAEAIVSKLNKSERYGKWKPMDLTWGRSIYYCTNCGASAEVPTEMGKPIYRFCPNCGVKMDKEKENETN